MVRHGRWGQIRRLRNTQRIPIAEPACRSEMDAWMARRRNRKPQAAAALARADVQALLTVRPKR